MSYSWSDTKIPKITVLQQHNNKDLDCAGVLEEGSSVMIF